jgi:cytochrome d ubiquinol oxidase subunit I
MNDTEMLGFAILGTAVILHIIIVNITIGTGWISAVARFLGWKKNDANLEIMGRKVFKILIVHELFSGVWGTIITVVLAGFFPTLTAIATDVIFYPILISLSSIIIRIPTIALFWYTWGKVRPGIHSAIGFVMALSGFAIPLGFRYIFSEITYPYAVGMALEGTSRDVVHTAVFSNPVYPPLLLHTWTGALSIGGFIVASFFAIKGNINARSAWTGLWHGALFLGLQAVMGPWYLLTLSSYAPLLFDNVLGVTGASFNVLPLFTLKMAVITGLVVLTAATWRRVKKGAG